MHTRIVLVYIRINPVAKHIFLNFLAIANLPLHLFFIANHYRRERLSPSLSSLSGDLDTCYPSRVAPGHVCRLWSFCSGHCCSRCSLVIGPFSKGAHLRRADLSIYIQRFVSLHLNHLPRLRSCLDSSYHTP